MLEDRREFPCQVIEMSPGDAHIIAPASGNVGEKIIAYIDHIGRIEGRIIEDIDGGFHMEVKVSPRKRDNIAAQLTWFANKDILNLPPRRPATRPPGARHPPLLHHSR